MSEKAKFRYSAQDGTLELEGSEEFVSQHFETLTDIIRLISRHTIIEQQKDPHEAETDLADEGEQDPPATGTSSGPDTISKFPAVFAEINGKLKIVSDIPGSSKKEKMANAAILYCYGSKLIGDEQVPSTEIRTVCEEHGCIDATNFAKIFNDKTIFLPMV